MSIFYIRVKHNTLTTLTLKNIMDSKTFWNKCKTATKIISVENGKILQDDKAFINYLTNQCCRHWGDWVLATPPFSGAKKSFCT